jgi:HTH-type transcriptional regulator, glycine betaine synthesis regulator
MQTMAKTIEKFSAGATGERPPRAAACPQALAEIQRGMAGIFADLADLLGNPSSLGSIYGLLFASPEPLSMEEIVDRLGISTGTASQGLRCLINLEAIVPTKSEGERIMRYAAKLELKALLNIFLKQRLLPRLNGSLERLSAIQSRLPDLPSADRSQLEMRLGRASKWHRRAVNLLPLINRFLGQ